MRVISRSLGAYYDGPGDGTGPIATVEDNAVAAGMTWFNSAGNSAGYTGGAPPERTGAARGRTPTPTRCSTSRPATSSSRFVCGSVLGLRWNDWGLDPTDYDAHVYDDPEPDRQEDLVDGRPAGWSASARAPAPRLRFGPATSTTSSSASSRGGPTTGDTLEFMVNQSAFEYWQNPYSAGQPASDTKSEGGVSVGAVDPALGTSIGYYSSQGPTNDGRTKPDLSAAACVKSFTVFPGNCFNGTSAATPVTAGAAALVLEAFPFYTPADLKTYLLNQATVPRGAAGHRQRVRRRGAVPAGTSGHPGIGRWSRGLGGRRLSRERGAVLRASQACNTNIGLAKVRAQGAAGAPSGSTSRCPARRIAA